MLKCYSAPLVFKDALDGQPEGRIQAVISTFETLDRDDEIVAASAFTDGQPLPMVWAHDWAVPIGRGVIHVQPDRAVFDGELFLDTIAGEQAYKTMRRMSDLQQFSWGFAVTQSEMVERDGKQVRRITGSEPFEASPVLIGSNRQTGILAIKAAIRSHGTATTDTAWDSGAAWRHCANEAASLKAACAWVDPDGDPAAKSSYRFIHHMVSADGAVGAANETACSTGIGVLNGGRGGTTIPDGDKAGVYAHLAKHLKDAGKEPPALKSQKYMGGGDAPDGSYEALSESLASAFRAQKIPVGQDGYAYVLATWSDHFIACLSLMMADEMTYWDVPYLRSADGTITLGTATEVDEVTTFVPAKGFDATYDLHEAQVRADVRGFLTRTKAGAAIRAKEGRAISTARRTRMEGVATSLRESAGEIDAMLAETAPPEKAAGQSGADAQRIAVLRLRSELDLGTLRRARLFGVSA